MINVMIVEDQAMPRKLFEMYIDSCDRYNLLFSIEDASMAEIYCLKHDIDLIIMDVVTEGHQNGLEAARNIKQRHPNIKIIIVTSMPEYSYIDQARRIGVDSFWYKETDRIQIMDLIDRTMAGESIYPESTPVLQLGLAQSSDFTPTELAVLKELTGGDTNGEIAKRMGVTEAAIKKHINSMLSKTGWKTRTELAVKASRLGLVIRNENYDE